ncbi:hypothetical protein RBE51_17905 [Pseudomonas taiwanensis]|uniref:hypothetical protein n=1 Tax=Pseudomonas taiwanensis TaxID=470150 RepID=UPI0028DE00C4|nr:hypothetical protein [Pseudomonas taiwanensis]MDT8924686.1 hypothetical protein [Pseudomonas taiwanensis]
MKLSFDQRFAPFNQYLEHTLNQPSYFESVEAMMKDLLGKEISHAGILEEGTSSPFVALAHLVNNPHLITREGMQADVKIETGDDELDTRVDIAVDMLCRSAHETIHMAPIDTVPVAAVKIIGRALQTLDLTPAHRPFGKLLVDLMDRSQHLEPVQQKEMQTMIASAFGAYRKNYGIDAQTEQQMSHYLHGETAVKLVTDLGFSPDNVRNLTRQQRDALRPAEPTFG